MHSINRWFICALATFGTFFLSGIGSWLVGGALGIWEQPLAGFLTALSVVCTAFYFAPQHKLATATFVLLIGASAAWNILEPSSYPESSALAYQPTHIPIIITYVGGLIGWAISWVLSRRASRKA